MIPAVDNHTEFVVDPQLFMGMDGERLCAMVKATLELIPSGGAEFGDFEPAPEERRRGLRAADAPWGKPEISSIIYPSDYCLEKPDTDVIVVAKAYPPGQVPVPCFDAGVRLGPLSKTVRVHGLRVWSENGNGVSEARPLRSLEMRYDFAYGGTAEGPDGVIEEPRNPVGRGVAGDPSTLTHQPAPQIEDPIDPVDSAKSKPTPAGLGAIGRHWEPRRKRWGTYDDRWLSERAPLPPLDFDARANQAASPGLVASPPLQGGESGAVVGLTPEGEPVAFKLPRIGVAIEFHRRGEPKPELHRPHLDTVLIDTLMPAPGSPLTLEMVWRASTLPPRRADDALVVVRLPERTQRKTA